MNNYKYIKKFLTSASIVFLGDLIGLTVIGLLYYLFHSLYPTLITDFISFFAYFGLISLLSSLMILLIIAFSQNGK